MKRLKIKAPLKHLCLNVADWYEEHIGTDFEYNLYLLYIDYYEQKLEGNLKEWIAKGSKNKPIQTLVNMHQFGYEVKKTLEYKQAYARVRSNVKKCFDFEIENEN